MQMKQCTNKNCEQPLKSIDEFSTDKKRPDGKTSWCKICLRKQNKKYREENYEQCLEKDRINSLNYYERNKEERKEAFKTYYNENKEERKEYRSEASKSYYENNKEKVQENHKEYDLQHPTAHLEATKRYYEKNPHVRLAQNAKRRADLLQRTPPWADQSKIKEVFKEAKLLESQDGIKRHVDHIIPLCGKTISGLHIETNLQILTANENQKKSNKI